MSEQDTNHPYITQRREEWGLGRQSVHPLVHLLPTNPCIIHHKTVVGVNNFLYYGIYLTLGKSQFNFCLNNLINLVIRAWKCDWRQWQPTPVLLPGKSHGQRSLVGCSPWGCEESDTTGWLHFHFSFSCIGEGNCNPLQCFCLENSRDRGAWWAAVYGVAQSRTRLKQPSSSSSSKGSLVAQLVKNPPAMQESPVQLLGLEDLLEKG